MQTSVCGSFRSWRVSKPPHAISCQFPNWRNKLVTRTISIRAHPKNNKVLLPVQFFPICGTGSSVNHVTSMPAIINFSYP